MNSFSNLQITDKTFGSGFQIKRNQDTINKFNDSMKNTNNTVDINMFEQPQFQNEDDIQGIGDIDFHSDKNAQKKIVIQTDRTNVLASEQAYLDANTANEYNPILHDGKLKRDQRSRRVREQDEVTVVAPGRDTQTEFQRMVAKENNKQIKKQSKDMIDNRVQYVERPLDLEYSKKVDVERPLLKKTIDNSMKFKYDFNDFQAKGREEFKPEKRMPVVPMLGLQMQQNQTQKVEAPEQIFSTSGNKLEPILETGGIKTTIPYSDINVARLISMPREIGRYVVENTYGRKQDSYTQPFQTLQTYVPQNKNTFHNYSQTLITGIKNVFAPKPIMTHDDRNTYVRQATNNINGHIAQVAGPTDMKAIPMNQPNFHEQAMQNRQSQNYGGFEDIYFP